MILKAIYILEYSIDNNTETLRVEVELKRNNEYFKSHENIYRGIAFLNGSFYDKKDLNHYVNALFAAEEIGLELKEDLKKKLRKEGKSFRLKKEELKEIKEPKKKRKGN